MMRNIILVVLLFSVAFSADDEAKRFSDIQSAITNKIFKNLKQLSSCDSNITGANIQVDRYKNGSMILSTTMSCNNTFLINIKTTKNGNEKVSVVGFAPLNYIDNICHVMIGRAIISSVSEECGKLPASGIVPKKIPYSKSFSCDGHDIDISLDESLIYKIIINNSKHSKKSGQNTFKIAESYIEKYIDRLNSNFNDILDEVRGVSGNAFRITKIDREGNSVTAIASSDENLASTISADKKGVKTIVFIGGGDGTQESAMRTVFAATSSILAIKRRHSTPKQRGWVLKRIMNAVNNGKTAKFKYYGYRITSSLTQGIGLMVTADRIKK